MRAASVERPRPAPADMSPRGDAAWHTLAPEEVVAQLGTSTESGLPTAEAARRLAEHGPNEIESDGGTPAWRLLLAQFRNVLILILLVAVLLSAALGHTTETIVIAIIVLFAAVLGFVQEYRAERAIEALRELAAPTATVIRDGEAATVPARELVPGDLVVLSTGDRASADGRVVEAISLQVEESTLTGESHAVTKAVEPLDDADLPLGDRTPMIYAGTAVASGRGRAIVVETGMRTEFGGIARLLQGIEPGKTPLQQSLDRVAILLARAAAALVVVVVGLGLLRGESFVDMLLFGAALAVAVVPEALPAVVTISLTLAAQRMIRRNVLVRRLPAIETLGSVSIIGTDKTGTLTKDEMTLAKVLAGGELFDVTGVGYDPHGSFRRAAAPVEPTGALLATLRAAALASEASLEHDGDGRWHVRGDATEGALIVAAAKAGLERNELEETYPKFGEIPFTPERKRMTTLHDGPDGRISCSKGAPEVILADCTRRLTEAGEERLDAAAREHVLATAQELAGEALRVLAVAGRTDATPENAERDLTFFGLVGMIDPPRPEARAAVQTCLDAGVTPVMITGDHPSTAESIARDLGVLANGRTITGAELEALDDDELDREVESVQVYARVSPAHKLRVVTALQARGHSVAMTGDGVNDAPALKQADIGVAMGVTGTDVTKEASDMTLTDDNFASIVAAVEEGRGVFGNIKKYLMYLLSANLGEIGLLVGASLLGKPLPLSAVQILYVNLATDGLPALALSVDPPEQGLMRRPPRRRGEGIFTRPVVTLILTGGAWSAAVTLGLFSWALAAGRPLEEAMTLTFATLVLIEFCKAYSYRSDRRSVLERPFANRWLNLAIAWELTLLGLVMYVPFLQDAFGTTGLSAGDWALAGAAAFTVVPVLEIAKRVIHRGSRGEDF